MCLFVGDFDLKGNYKKRLEDKIIAADLAEKIKFVGPTTNMPVVYSICDLVISSSIKPEAFGRIAIEAGAMGKIIVATNIGGSKETVINNKTGFLIEPNNAEQLAQKINQLLNIKDDLRQKICHKARENIVKNFSNDLMLQKTLKIYQELMENQ